MTKKRVNMYPKAFRQMALERMRSCENVSALAQELGGGSYRAVSLAESNAKGGRGDGEFPCTRASEGDSGSEARAGREGDGTGFFQRCLAKSRGSTPERQGLWRDGIYDQIREVMPMQGSPSIERMCQMARVSRAGFYR